MGDEVLVKRDSGVMEITLNRPHRRNALTWPLIDGVL